MTVEELNILFTKNYKEYKIIAIKHTKALYETDVVMSNLYMHLVKYVDEIIDEKTLLAYTIIYCQRLKIWRKNKPLSLTELNIKDVDYVADVDVLIDNDWSTLFDDNINEFISLCDLKPYQKKLLVDYYTHNLVDYKSVMKFYNQRSTYGYKIFNETKTIISQFEEYIKKKYTDV